MASGISAISLRGLFPVFRLVLDARTDPGNACLANPSGRGKWQAGYLAAGMDSLPVGDSILVGARHGFSLGAYR